MILKFFVCLQTRTPSPVPFVPGNSYIPINVQINLNSIVWIFFKISKVFNVVVFYLFFLIIILKKFARIFV